MPSLQAPLFSLGLLNPMSIHPRLSHHCTTSTHSLIPYNSSFIFVQSSLLLLTGQSHRQSTSQYFFEEFEDTGPVNPRWEHRLPENPTIWDRALFPWLTFLAWMRLLCDNFDGRFIVMVVCGQHLLKGLLAGGPFHLRPLLCPFQLLCLILFLPCHSPVSGSSLCLCPSLTPHPLSLWPLPSPIRKFLSFNLYCWIQQSFSFGNTIFWSQVTISACGG